MQRGSGTRSDVRRARIEAVALAGLAVLPLLPYFLYLARTGIPRFAFMGDYAGLELATRLVTTGKTLLGPYSRFGFSHPGPLYFYLMTPVYWLWGGKSAGLFAAACSVNVLAAMVTVAAVRLAATRAHALAVTLLLAVWFAAFGDACALPWNPLVVVLPLVAFLVLAALIARGSLALAPLAVFFGALVAETHLSTIPTVLGVSLVTIGAVVVQRRRSKPRLERADRLALVAAAAVLALTITPPLLEQLVAPEGNLTKIVRFFAHRPEPMKPLDLALRDWAFATSWLPDRLLESTMLHEEDPGPMRSEAAPAVLSVTALRATLALLLLASAAGVVAWRRRDTASLALLAMGATASVLAVLALRAIVGADYIYLLYWMTAGSTLLWMGVLTTLTSWLGELGARRAGLLRLLPALAILLCLGATLASTSLQRRRLALSALAPTPYPPVPEAYPLLVAHLARTNQTPVIHADAAWHIAMSYLLELSRDGIPAAIVERDRWLLGRQIPGAEGIDRPLHVYVRLASHPLALAPCLQSLAINVDFEIMVSDTDVTTCAPRSP